MKRVLAWSKPSVSIDVIAIYIIAFYIVAVGIMLAFPRAALAVIPLVFA